MDRTSAVPLWSPNASHSRQHPPTVTPARKIQLPTSNHSQQQNPTDVSTYPAEIRRLSELGLHDSAILLGSLTVTLCADGFQRSKARIALAQALRADNQNKRALQTFQDALHDISRVQLTHGNLDGSWIKLDAGDVSMLDHDEQYNEDLAGNSSNGLPVDGENDAQQGDDDQVFSGADLERGAGLEKKRRRKSASPESNTAPFVLAKMQAEIKFRMAQCYVAMDQEENAIAVLDALVNSASTTSSTASHNNTVSYLTMEHIPGAALALLGRLKRRSGSSKGSVSLLKETVSREPFALEVILTLLDLEVEVDEIMKLITLKGKRKVPEWLEQLIRAHAAASSSRTREAMQKFSLLSTQTFRSNSHVLTQLAKLELQLGNREPALALFTRARQVDPLAIESADVYASLLKTCSEKTKLVQLTHDLLNFGAQDRPEPWVSAALLSELRNDKDKALTYVGRAIELDPLHVPALHFKGNLLLGKRPMESLSAFAKALSVRRDFEGLKGLVDSYLSMQPPKVIDAMTIAKEAVELMPNDARPFILMGKALACQIPTERLAVESLMRALRLDANNVQASILLADIRLSQFRRSEVTREILLDAAGILQKCVHHTAGFGGGRSGFHAMTSSAASNNGVGSSASSNPNGIVTKDSLYCKIGNLFVFAGERGRALENFHDALSVNPSSIEAKKALEALENLGPQLGSGPSHHLQPPSAAASLLGGIGGVGSSGASQGIAGRQGGRLYNHISPGSIMRRSPTSAAGALRLSSASSLGTAGSAGSSPETSPQVSRRRGGGPGPMAAAGSAAFTSAMSGRRG